MDVVEKSYKWNTKLSTRSKTTRIILHHAACEKCTPEQIDEWHKAKGWSGIGYHFFIRKDGTIYRGRPENAVGAHAFGNNKDSVGICFEGNYEKEKTMPSAQLSAGKELVAYIKEKYGISKVQKHSDVCSTACPGVYFPFSALATATAAKKKIDVSDYPIIRLGSTGEAVKKAQQTLSSRGYKGKLLKYLKDDGVFGDNTEYAVKNFQKKNGLVVDGVVGAKTWDKLING